jgi:3-oxoacyl-[acyl-carrier protein] reductase
MEPTSRSLTRVPPKKRAPSSTQSSPEDVGLFAERIPGPGISLYAASKAALVGLTKGMARDLGSRGITVNIVHLGSTNTDMNPADGPSASQQLGRMAIPRFGEATDVAALVSWLAGSEGRFVTGAALTIDGGANV